ncbi:MAG TPA: hypothetical protein VGN61_03940 [Verrucomicrobiae bacterium]|jgi:hypothetical protein
MFAAATNFVPAADEAIASQLELGTLSCTQFAPASLEVQIPPGLDPDAAAAIFCPSAEEAIDHHVAFGALVCAQLIPELVEVQIPP